MKKDFILEANSASIIKEDIYLDLHSCYNVLSIQFNTNNTNNKRVLQLNFERAKECNNDPLPTKVGLCFEGVQFLEMNTDLSSPKLYDIWELGYKNIKDNDYSWLYSEDEASEDSCLVILFNDNNYVKVYSEVAYLVIEPKKT